MNVDVGRQLHAVRTAFGLSQRELAKRAGVTNGIAGAMAPIDQAKGLGVPGSEAKELFLPTNKLSGSFQVNSNLSLVGYYSFEWEPTRYPAPGSYFALSEISMDKAEALAAGLPGSGPVVRVGGAHAANLTNPEPVNAAIREFLAGLPD